MRERIPLTLVSERSPARKVEEIWRKIGLLWQVFHIPDRVYLTVAAGGGTGGGFLGQYYTIYDLPLPHNDPINGQVGGGVVRDDRHGLWSFQCFSRAKTNNSRSTGRRSVYSN